jgi:hypothetical protein
MTRREFLLSMCGAAATTVLLNACTSRPRPDAEPSGARPPDAKPLDGCILGAWPDAVAARLGVSRHVYRAWGEPLEFPDRPKFVNLKMHRRGQTVNSAGIWPLIARGDEDRQIRRYASQIRALDYRFFFTLGHEPRQTQGTPTDYVAAWERCMMILRDEGADNAIYSSCLLAYTYQQDRHEQWTPLDLIDAVGCDGYATKSAQPTFDETFAAFLDYAPDKPHVIFEVAYRNAAFGTAGEEEQRTFYRTLDEGIKANRIPGCALWVRDTFEASDALNPGGDEIVRMLADDPFYSIAEPPISL